MGLLKKIRALFPLNFKRDEIFTLESRADYYLRSHDEGVPRDTANLPPEYDPVLCKHLERKANFPKFRKQAKPRKNISKHTEFRNMNQILLRHGTTIKAGAILNGRSRTCKHGIDAGEDLYVKERAYIDAYGGSICIGRGAAIAQFCAIHGNGGVLIGDYLMMGHGALILAGNHNYDVNCQLPFIFQGSTTKGIVIGTNVWLGAGAIVLDGAKIGDNVVVAAGTVVRGTIPSNSLVVADQSVKIIDISK